MQNFLGTIIGKLVRLAVFFRHNGGHALPGLIVDRLLPNYITTMLSQLPEGIVFVTGTNGKTTTTKMVVHLLEKNGKRVITNSTGSNMVRGIVSGLAKDATIIGKLKFDIAVLEVDEASAKPLTRKIKPRWVLALNVSRDQLDRFGEVDTIANHIKLAMGSATEGLVINAGDPLLSQKAEEVAVQNKLKLEFFDAAYKLRRFFPSDYELAAVNIKTKTGPAGSLQVPAVQLSGFKAQTVEYKIGNEMLGTKFTLSGQHNFLNGAAAIALVRQLLPKASPAELVSELGKVSIAFGRGESYRFKNGATVELVLVKNPASFRQALASYGGPDHELTLAINDNIADGRDVSWLWDVDFRPLIGSRVGLTAGSRAADMALRLRYDGIKASAVEPDLESALRAVSKTKGRKVILATYTAMLKLYGLLNKKAEKIL